MKTPGLYWVRVPEMADYDPLLPAQLDKGGKVWVLGFDLPFSPSEITVWGPPLYRHNERKGFEFCAECRGITHGTCDCVFYQDFIDTSACVAHKNKSHVASCRCARKAVG